MPAAAKPSWFSLAILSGATAPCTPSDDLRVEYLANPLGLDVAAPRFSWELADSSFNSLRA